MPDLLYYILAGVILLLGVIVCVRKDKATDARMRFWFLIVDVAAVVLLTFFWLGLLGVVFGGC
ncbi:MAG TPA: hypothetical protein VM054_05025 [bacterium]|nr:hypothetical protein [bacterium]